MQISFDFKFGFWQRLKIFLGIPVHIVWKISDPGNGLSIVVKGEIANKNMLSIGRDS